jgi:hypothetical protein
MISKRKGNTYLSILYSSLLFVVMVLVIGCSSKPEKHFKTDYTGKDDKGVLRKECTFLSGSNENFYRHHCKIYDENGKLNQEGDFINDTIPVGWQKYFRSNGKLQAMREFYEVSTSIIYLNQVIRFEENGVDTNFEKSSFYSIVFEKDTVKKGEQFVAFISIKAPYYKNSYMDVTFVNDDGQEVELPGNKTLSTVFTATVEKKGVFELKGYLNETEVLQREGDTLKVNQRKLYFNKKYWVQ